MAGFTIIATLLTQLITIAASIGLSKAVTQIDEARTHANNVSPSQIAGIIDGMMSEARTRGTDIYNRLVNKINAIPSPFIQSSEVKRVLQSARKRLTSTAEEVSKAITRAENDLSSDQQKLSALSMQTDDYKSKYGKEVVEDAKYNAKKASYDLNQTLNKVESLL